MGPEFQIELKLTIKQWPVIYGGATMSSHDDKGRKKLLALVKHGLEHNQEHEREVKDWANKASELDETEVQQDLLDAAKKLNKASSSLKRALSELEED
jgi:RNA polymerase-binding transcription factor DksA